MKSKNELILNNLECSIMLSKISLINITNEESKKMLKALIEDLEILKQKTKKQVALDKWVFNSS